MSNCRKPPPPLRLGEQKEDGKVIREEGLEDGAAHAEAEISKREQALGGRVDL